MSENMPTKEPTERQFEQFLSQLPGEMEISDDQAIRLAHARAKALGFLPSQKTFWFRPAMAASLLLAGIGSIYSLTNTTETKGLPAELAVELDVITDDNERELINDLEFYQWLSEMEAG